MDDRMCSPLGHPSLKLLTAQGNLTNLKIGAYNVVDHAQQNQITLVRA
jgi:hypothetical protein